MDAFTVYRTYLGIKSHFQHDSYDFSKYGATRAKPATFLKRKDKYFFEKLAAKYKDNDIVDIFVSNFMEFDNLWVGDLFTEEKQKVLAEYRKRKESLDYKFQQDLTKLCDRVEIAGKKFNDLFAIKSSGHPEIFKLVMSKFIHPETYCILNDLLGFSTLFDAKLSGDHFYENYSKKLRKYAAFLDLSSDSKKSYKKSVLETISRHSVA